MLALLAALAIGQPMPHQAAGPCDHARTTAAMVQCLADTLRVREDSLRGIEKLIRSAVSPDVRRRFEDAANAWDDYRARECRAMAAQYAGGSMAGVTLAGCRLGLTEARLGFLASSYAAILPGRGAS